MIATIPVYLSLSDFGLGTAASVDMTSAMARNDRKSAMRAFQSVWTFMTMVTTLIALIVVVCVAVWGFMTPASTASVFSPSRIAGTITLITIAALLIIQMSICKSIFQATHKYALGTVILDLASLADGLIVIAIAMLGGDILLAAAGMLATRIISTLFCHLILSRIEPWCRPGWSMADKKTLQRLLHPSLGALALTLANSLGLQGMVLSIGFTFGPATAAIFATSRMLTRIPLQFSTLLSRASLPELTRAQVDGHHELTRKLMRANLMLAFASVLPFTLILAFWGPELQSKISNGEMAATSDSFAVLGIAALLNALWSTLGAKLLATNQQGTFAWIALIMYAACAGLPFHFNVNYLLLLIFFALSEAAILIKIIAVYIKK